MNNIFIIGVVISFIFLLFKFIEMRFVDKESKPVKYLVKDSLVVYFSVITGYFIINQLKPIIQSNGVTQVFTENPDF